MEFREGMAIRIKENGRIRYGELNGRPCMLNDRVGNILMIMSDGIYASVRFPGVINPYDNSDLFVFKMYELERAVSPKDEYCALVRGLGYSTESKQWFTGLPAITRVLYNDPATIIFWNDGTKTIVKCGEHDEFDPEKGLAMAISKKVLGNKGNYYDEFKKWLPKTEVESEKTDKTDKTISEDAVLKAFDDAAKYFVTMTAPEDIGDVNNE